MPPFEPCSSSKSQVATWRGPGSPASYSVRGRARRQRSPQRLCGSSTGRGAALPGAHTIVTKPTGELATAGFATKMLCTYSLKPGTVLVPRRWWLLGQGALRR